MSLTAIDRARPAAPAPLPRAVRVAADVGLSVATGLVADQVSRSLVRRGTLPSVAAGLAAGIGLRAVAEGAGAMIDNARQDKDLTEGLTDKMLDGARLGAIDSGLALLADPLQRRLQTRLPQYTRAMQLGISGAALGTLAGAAETATRRETWQDGATQGLARVGAAAGVGAAGGAVFGAITGHLLHRADAARWTKAALNSADDPAQQIARGGLKRLAPGDRLQGSDIAGGIQPSILIEHESPSVQRLLGFAREVGDNPRLSTWQKVEKIQDEINRVLRYANKNPEDQAKFFALNRQYLGDAIPVGKYLDLGIADCRTFATVSQMAYQEAGVPAYFAYNRTAIAGKYRVDHAFNVVVENGKATVADSLFKPWFNRMPLDRAYTSGKLTYRVEPHPGLPFVYRDPSQNVLPRP